MVSQPFELEPSVASPNADPSTTLQTVSTCGPQRCFAAYTQYIGPGEDSDWGTRFSAAAEMLDVPRISLSGPGWPLLVLPNGNDFVVVHGQGGGDKSYTALSRVRGSDGARTTTVTTGLPPNYFTFASATDSSVLLINHYQGNQAYLYDNTFARIGNPVSIPLGIDLSTIVPGPDQYLIVAAGAAVRLDSKTGALLDSTAITFAKYAPLGTGPIRGAYKDGVYLLSWFSPANSDLLAVRIRASDGAVLDPPDEFNQAPGYKVLCAGCKQQTATLGRMPHVNVINGALVVTFMRSDTSELFGFPVDPSTGLRAGGVTTLPPPIGNLPLAALVEVYSVGNAAMARQGNFAYPITPSNAASGFTLGARQPIALLADARTGVQVASNGTDYLVTFSSGKTLYATRVKESTGTVLDQTPLVLGTGVRSAIASDGDGYLVVWPKNYQSFGRARVGADGSVTPLADLPTDFTPDVSYPLPSGLSLTFNGTYYCLAWTQSVVMFEKRMLPDGTPVDEKAVPLRPGDYNAVDRALVLADTTPTPDRRTFLYLFANRDLFTRRIRSETGAVLGFTTLATGVADGQRFGGASDGTNALVAYQAGTNLSAASVDFVTALATRTVNIMNLGNQGSLGRAWYDGASFNLVLYGISDEFGRSLSFVQRVDANLARLDDKVPGLGTPLVSLDNANDFDVAAAKGKRSLFVYADTAPERFGMMARAVWIENDGQPAPVPSGSGGASSTGGSASGISGGAFNTNTGGGGVGSNSGGIANVGGSNGGGSSSTSGGVGQSAGEAGQPSSGGSRNEASGGVAGALGNGGMQTSGGTFNNAGGAGKNQSAGNGGGSAGNGGASGGDSDASGCGCRTAPQRPTKSAWLAFAALGAVVVRRRTRRSVTRA
ncbi:MAG: MYXO-CTERM sorting domain-containing protein [Myxococcota bacterium]